MTEEVQEVQQPPVGRAAFASVSFLSVLLRLLLLSHWTPSLYRVLLESAFDVSQGKQVFVPDRTPSLYRLLVESAFVAVASLAAAL